MQPTQIKAPRVFITKMLANAALTSISSLSTLLPPPFLLFFPWPLPHMRQPWANMCSGREGRGDGTPSPETLGGFLAVEGSKKRSYL